MIHIDEINVYDQNGTDRLICLAALSRGWKVMVLKLPTGHIFIDRGDGKRFHLFSSTAPTTSYSDANLVNDKYSTYRLLKDSGIYQLDTLLLSYHESRLKAIEFMQKHGRVVVKPVDGSHGRGITVNVSSTDMLESAILEAGRHNKSFSSVLLQEQFLAKSIHDVRVTVIRGKVVAAIERIPARVLCDGVHTVRELIEFENTQPDRGVAYRDRLALIDIRRAEQYLGAEINSRPTEGTVKQVLGVANYGAGGELVDVTDFVPGWMNNEAVECAALLKLDVAGVDFLTNKRALSSYGRNELRAVITEVNKCPALAIHDEPTEGVNRHTVDAYLDFIATL